MRNRTLWRPLSSLLPLLCCAGVAAVLQAGETRVSIDGDRWRINGELTYPGAPAEGLLLNVRMVNATFEDTHRPDFNSDANTGEFLAQIPAYAAHGVLAFTLCLQGGMPDYEGALNSAFNPDGSLRPQYLDRVARVIRECDRRGLVVILGCYYQRQDQVLADETAVRAGVVNVATWLRDSGFSNVLLEITNETGHKGFDHRLLKTPQGQVELIRLARQTAPGLLISTSGLGNAECPPEIAREADFLLIHLNSTRVSDIGTKLGALQRYGKPVVCNEDQKLGQTAVEAATACVQHHASWGFMHREHNQRFPFAFDGPADDPLVYAALRRLATPGASSSDAPSTQTTADFPPPDAEGGWTTLTDAEDIRRATGFDVAKLDEAFTYIQSSTKNGGLLVLRHGLLVYEQYFGLGHREATPNLASCGKSFTSVAVGILMHERPELFPQGLDQKVFTPTLLPPEAFPLTDPRKADIKLGQLLAFTAGIRGNNPCYVRGQSLDINPPGPDGSLAATDAIALGIREQDYEGHPSTTRTLWCDPGEGYSYSTASIHIASILLRHVTGQELEHYVADHLARPLGWGRWGWGYRAALQPEGHTSGGGGIALRATDMLRFGYLLLHQGKWRDRQIIPADYVRHATQASPYNPHFPYSLQFNVNTGGEQPDLPRDAFWKTGSGGHVLYVVPSLDLVVWKLGGRDGQYSPDDTGLPRHPDVPLSAPERAGWREEVDARTAAIETLKRVLDALDAADRTSSAGPAR